jgi:hypothetical protein
MKREDREELEENTLMEIRGTLFPKKPFFGIPLLFCDSTVKGLLALPII